MPDPHLSRLRTKYQAEADKAERRLAQIKKALEGIEAAIELEEEAERETDETEETEGEAESGDVMELIQSEAVSYEGAIRAPSFARHLEEKYPGRTFVKSTVSHALRQGVENGVLVLIERGQGKRPSVYKSIIYVEQPQEEVVVEQQQKEAEQISRRDALLRAKAARPRVPLSRMIRQKREE